MLGQTWILERHLRKRCLVETVWSLDVQYYYCVSIVHIVFCAFFICSTVYIWCSVHVAYALLCTYGVVCMLRKWCSVHVSYAVLCTYNIVCILHIWLYFACCISGTMYI